MTKRLIHKNIKLSSLLLVYNLSHSSHTNEMLQQRAVGSLSLVFESHLKVSFSSN